MQKIGKVIIPDGKICSGKSTYTRRLRDETGAIALMVDEAILRVFSETPDRERVGAELLNLIEYMLELAADMALYGATVVLEIGYFNNAERDAHRKFFKERGVPYEWHYLNVSDEVWQRNLASREAEKDAGENRTFRITDAYLQHFNEAYEEPDRADVDVWIDIN